MAGETIYLELGDEQRVLSKAAQRALKGVDTLTAARGALDGDPADDLWGLAVDAGWPGLLSAEDVDGAGLGVYEAMLVLELCGARLADAHLLGHLPATALVEAGAAGDSELRSALAVGERRAALVDLTLASVEATLTRDGDGALGGQVRDVIDAPGADVLVVVLDGHAVLVEAAADGVSVTAQPAYDATRSLGTVTLENVTGTDLPTGDPALGAALQRALLGAESVGAAQACLEMARDYAAVREAFGRKIGSYQALKHKLVEMLRKTENGRSLMVAAGRAAGTDGFATAANALRVVGSDALDYAAPENIFIHGGIGATWDHDAQLYYRRAEVSRRLAGGSEAAARAVADALLASV